MKNFRTVGRALLCLLALSMAASACGDSNPSDNKSRGGLQGSWKPSNYACTTGQETAQLQQASQQLPKDLWYVFESGPKSSSLSVRQTVQSQPGLTTVDGQPSCTSEDNYQVTLNDNSQMTVKNIDCKPCNYNYTNEQTHQQSQVQLGCGNFADDAKMSYATDGDSLKVTFALPAAKPVQDFCTGATDQKITLVLKRN